MKTKILIGLLVIGILSISGCVQEEALPADSEEAPYYTETDSSIVWESLNGPPGGGNVDNLIQNPYRHNELYATTRHGLYKSEDKGESWQKISESEKASIAVFEDKLFTCRDGVHYYDNGGNPIKILDGWCSELAVSDNKLFVSSGGGKISDVKILYADLASGSFDWKDVSLPESELRDLALSTSGKGIRVRNIVAVGNRILANIIVEGGGRGELTKSHLYISEDLGGTWSKIGLGEPDGVSIAKIAQNRNNPEHLVLSFKHNIVHEGASPISELLRESYDGGKTWNKPTGLILESNCMGKGGNSNGIEDVVILGSAYYLLSPYGGPSILKLDGSSCEEIPTPMIGKFTDMSFGLDKLLFDFDDPNIVYGKTGSIWAMGIIKSVDGMKTWKKMDRDIIASCPTIVLAHPTDPNIVFTSGNVIQESYATRDFGETWEPFTPVNAGDDVKIDPHNPEHMILADELTRLYESYDAGRTFTKIAENFSSAKVFDFEVAKDSGKIYVSNIGVGISENATSGGKGSWQYLTYSSDYAYDIELDPEDSSIIYATYSPKIFESHSSIWRYSKNQSENSGWSELFRFENSAGITSIRFDPNDPNRLYAGVIGEEGTIYVSNDKGKTWDKLNDELTFTTIMRHSQLQVDPNNKNIIYAGTWGGGTYKSIDGGKNWVKLENAPESPTCLAIYEKNPDIIYACDRVKPVIHKSEDGGQTWQEYYEFDRTNVLTSAVAIDPNDPDTIYAATFGLPFCVMGGLVVKITDGKVVKNLSETLPGNDEGVAESAVEIEVDPNNPNTIYVSKHGYGVFKSVDGGNSWERLDDRGTGLPRLGYYDIDVDYSNSNNLYAAGLCELLPEYIIGPTGLPKNIEQDACGAYKSTDGGESWTRMLETEHATMAVEVDPQNPNLLYVASSTQGLFVSSDGGESWKQENEGLPSFGIAAVIAKEGYVYASAGGSGVYAGTINDDYSITWDNSRSNKPKVYVSRIQVEIDPENSNRIYATAYPGGMFRSDDAGKTWYERNTSQPSIIVDDPITQGYYSFAIDPNNPADVWMGAYGKGMYRSHEYMNVCMFANGNKNELLRKDITAVAINPKDSKTVYVGTQQGVFVTKDDGESWTEMNDGLDTLDIRSLKITSAEYPPSEYDFEDGTADGWKSDTGWSVIQEKGNYVLQGIGHNWILTGSESWTDYTFESKVKLIEGQVHVNYRVSGADRYAIGVGGGSLYLMRTFKGKHTQLKSVAMQFSQNKWYNIKIVGNGNNIKVYVNGNLKIDYTDGKPLLNGRIAFESLPDSKIRVDDVAVTIDSADSEIYAGTAGYGIYKFNHTSKEWQNLGNTLGSGFWSPWERRMYQFSSILFDPDVPGKIYYGHFPSGFFISEDNGHTWRDSSLGLGNDGMFSLSMHPDNHDILFAGTYNGVAKSVNRGKIWEMISNGIPPEQWPYTVAIDDQNPDIMYTSTKNGQNMGFCERNDFCGVVMKTTDGGESWFKIMNGLDEFRSEFYSLLIYPPNHNVLFLSTNRGVYISRDAGNSWKAMNTGLPNTDNQVRDNVADNLALTADNKYLIFGLVDSGAWKADLSKAGLGS